jgi:hypothetical protein
MAKPEKTVQVGAGAGRQLRGASMASQSSQTRRRASHTCGKKKKNNPNKQKRKPATTARP